MTILSDLVVILLCMAGTAFFAGIETGVISIHRMRLRHFVREKVPGASVLEGFLEDPDRLDEAELLHGVAQAAHVDAEAEVDAVVGEPLQHLDQVGDPENRREGSSLAHSILGMTAARPLLDRGDGPDGVARDCIPAPLGSE